MKTLVFAPYARGLAHENLLLNFAEYLKDSGSQVDILSCNGCHSVCQRSANSQWKTGVSRCFSCNSDQAVALKNFNKEKEIIKLGSFISSAEAEQAYRLVFSTRASELASLTWGKTLILDLCIGTFESRFNTREFNSANKEQESFMRQLFIVALQQIAASSKILSSGRYKLSLVSDANDVLTTSFLVAARASGCSPTIFKYDRLDANVFVVNPSTQEIKVFERFPSLLEQESILSSQGISSTNSSMLALKEEIHKTLKELGAFIGIENEQLSLLTMGK